MILAIETSTPTASLALLHPATGKLVAERTFTSDRAHNSAIFGPLSELLDALTGPLEWIVTGTGPGSYSGIRVGIAVANGLAVAHGARTFGWPSLAAVGMDAEEWLAVGDARRKSFFAADVKAHALAGDLRVLDETALAAEVEAAVDRGLPVMTLDERPPLGMEGVTCLIPSATRLARIAAELPVEERARLAALPLEPIYVREPHITQAKPRIRSA